MPPNPPLPPPSTQELALFLSYGTRSLVRRYGDERALMYLTWPQVVRL